MLLQAESGFERSAFLAKEAQALLAKGKTSNIYGSKEGLCENLRRF